jgi:hypothetical protein
MAYPMHDRQPLVDCGDLGIVVNVFDSLFMFWPAFSARFVHL